MSPPAPSPEFFVDPSLGRKRVPEALRAEGLVLHTMAEVYGERPWIFGVYETGIRALMRLLDER